MSTAFFTDGERLMTQGLDVGAVPSSRCSDTHTVYEITRCVKWIQDNGFKRVWCL